MEKHVKWAPPLNTTVNKMVKTGKMIIKVTIYKKLTCSKHEKHPFHHPPAPVHFHAIIMKTL